MAKRPSIKAISSSQKTKPINTVHVPQSSTEPLKDWELYSQLLQWKYLEHCTKRAFERLQEHADNDIYKAYLRVSGLEKELKCDDKDLAQENKIKDNVQRLEEVEEMLEIIDAKLSHPGFLDECVDFIDALDYHVNSLNLNDTSCSSLGIFSIRHILNNY
jgi:hypothetical protein